ncbi:DUF6503 family protein [Winogradskyella sp. PE311]|uniref:DUF6503 family protein n=1 Tax=Winogradskyella sp. PE311 TaxID=3366943 RepID=UPI003980F3C1
MKYFSILFLSLVLIACKTETKTKVLSADAIIDKSIAISGGEIFNSEVVIIKFKFRDIQYKSTYTSEAKVLSRLIVKENDSIIDFLKGDLFQRYIDERPVELEDSMVTKYSASVNSVHYFSTLPFGLNDKAVNKKRFEYEKIKGKDYYKIKVTFNKDGGGEDYDDVFIYWINKTSLKPDYLAYSYNEDDGVGMRFREAYNERYIKGLRFVDYNNYKSENKDIKLADLGKAFNDDTLKLLSKIELENIEVELIKK